MRETRYRFLGRINPADREKHGIRAELMPAEVADGVAKMYLYDPIDSYGGYWGVSAREFAESLAALDSSVEEIRLHINSPGGEVFEGIAIKNNLVNHPARIVAVVDGLAASAASFIAAAADEVVMGQNSELMIHDAWGITIGPAEDHTSMAKRLGALSDNIASIYARKAGGAAADWRPAMLAETWYSADEAVAAGLADSVAGDGEAEQAPANAFDTEGMFTYPGRQSAPAPNVARLPVPLPGRDQAAATVSPEALERYARRVAAMRP